MYTFKYTAMNKIISLAGIAVALLALAACNKESDSIPVAGPEIGIRAMSAAPTKSAINGTAFPNAYDMHVSTYRNLGSNAGVDEEAANYFSGINFARDAGGTWKPSTPKYWPFDGTLDFLAVATAGYNTAENGIAPACTWGDESSNKAKKVVLTVPDNSSRFDDILFGAANAQAKNTAGVGMVFHHAEMPPNQLFLKFTNHSFQSLK